MNLDLMLGMAEKVAEVRDAMKAMDELERKMPVIRQHPLVPKGQALYLSPDAILRSQLHRAPDEMRERMATRVDRGIVYLHPDDYHKLYPFAPRVMP